MKLGLLVGGVVVFGLTVACERQPRVVGARRALPAGTRLTLGDIQPIELAAPPRPTQHIEVERAARVIGATLARDVDEGAAITVDDLTPTRGGQRLDSSRQRRGLLGPRLRRVRGAARRVAAS